MKPPRIPPHWPAIALAAFAFAATDCPAAGAARPNILLLLTDDQRFDTIAALGNPAIRTPALDGLARTGFVFRNAYTLGSNMGAVCTPSRNMLVTGRAYFRWEGPHARPDGSTLPEALNAAGYETYYHGKKGNTAPLVEAKFGHSKVLANNDLEHVGGEPGKFIVDEAIAFLEARTDTRPLYMQLAWPNPHDPRTAADKYMSLYKRGEIPLPGNYLPVHPFDNGEMTVRDECLAPWPRTEDEIRRHLHEYYAVITCLDGHIGRLLAALRARGMSDNTIVIFTSDNGLSIGSHGLMGKQNVYEPGLKVPLLFAGPGVPKGETAAFAYLMDLCPTICDFAGAAPGPAALDGASLRPVIEGRAPAVRDSLFLAYRDVQRSVRDQRWKLIRYPRINRTQLFDLETDPGETRDLSADPAHAARIDALLGRMRQWQQRLGDAAPLDVPNPLPAAFTPPTPAQLETLRQKTSQPGPGRHKGRPKATTPNP